MVTRRSRLPSPVRLLGVLLAAALAVTVAPATPSWAAPTAGRVAAPSGTDVGRWDVAPLGEGRYRVSWTSPTDLQLNSDRPTIGGAGLRFGPSTVAGDARTVEAVVTAVRPPDPADLDVVLSGTGSTRAATTRPPAAAGRSPWRRRPRRCRPPTPVSRARSRPSAATTPCRASSCRRCPGRSRWWATSSSLRPTRPPARGRSWCSCTAATASATTPPTTTPTPRSGRAPGRSRRSRATSATCTRQQLLASQGYATVSIRVNGINAQDYRLDDGGADARAAIVARHLDHWVGLAAEHQVDLDQVVLVGHSRGGEGVDRAAIEIPRSAPYRIAGQVLLAPTDFASHTAPYVPTVTVLPYCDGDVSDIQGQQFTDTGRDLVSGDTSLKSSVLVMGANHNFFNTEWTPGTAAAPSFDDWGGKPDEPCGRKHPGRLQGRPAAGRGQGLHRRCRPSLRR